MMANGKMVKEMEKVFIIILMVLSMMANGKMVNQMEKVL
jgi:hypothetical protein